MNNVVLEMFTSLCSKLQENRF